MMTISDFVSQGPVDRETIDAYRGRVPDDMIELWQTYGYGAFGEGFIRVINPSEYEDGVGDCIGRVIGGAESIPLMVTGLADLIVWEPGSGLNALLYRMNDTAGLGASISTHVNLTVRGGAKHLARKFDWAMFPEAVRAHGAPAFDESFVFVPLLSLGGPKKVENIQPRKTIEAIRMMVEFQGLIEH